MPAYALNADLEATAAPPVPLARAWAATFPGEATHAEARELPLLNLAQGVPGHLPSEALLARIRHEAAREPAAAAGYGGVFGAPELRQALAADVRRRYGGDCAEQDIAITAGANLAAAVAFQAVARRGDAVVLPTPWYFNHEMTLSSLGVHAVPLRTEAPSYLPSPAALRELLASQRSGGGPMIRALALVTPNNPTGAIYPPELLREFSLLCREQGIALILDETYRDFLLDEAKEPARPHGLFEDADWRETMMHIHSYSKAYAIPGHRLGALVASPELLAVNGKFGAVAKALDNLQICPPRTDTQRAVAWAMQAPEHVAWRLTKARELAERRALFNELMRPLKELGWRVESAGAYYAYVAHPWTGTPSEVVAEQLAARVGVVVLPGAFFSPRGSPEDAAQRLRVSIANVDEELLRSLPQRLQLLKGVHLR